MMALWTREAVMEIKEMETGKSEGLGGRLHMVSGGRDLVSRITPMFLSSHN